MERPRLLETYNELRRRWCYALLQIDVSYIFHQLVLGNGICRSLSPGLPADVAIFFKDHLVRMARTEFVYNLIQQAKAHRIIWLCLFSEVCQARPSRYVLLCRGQSSNGSARHQNRIGNSQLLNLLFETFSFSLCCSQQLPISSESCPRRSQSR
jgi:hypothetical protein